MNILFELEDKVKEQFLDNPLDENMYSVIKDLTEKILVVKKLVSNREDVDQVSHDYAVNLWIRICEGYVVEHWTKYIMLNLSSTLHAYYKSNNKSQIQITISDPVDKEMFVETLYGSSFSNDYVRKFEMDDYLTTLYIEIKNDVLKYSRTTNIVLNRKLYLSVLANLFKEKSLVSLSDDQSDYVSFICKLVRQSIYVKSVDIINNKEFMPLAQIVKSYNEGTMKTAKYDTENKEN